MNERGIFETVFASIGCFLTYIFGGADTCIIVLAGFIMLDYITGVFSGIIQHTLNSHIGFNGILRKSTIFLVLIVAVLLDRLLNSGIWIFRTLVCYFYIANEGISICENVGKCGVPLPKKLISVLEQLKKDSENDKN